VDLGLAVVKRKEIPGQMPFDGMDAPPVKAKRKRNAADIEKDSRPWARAYRPTNPPPCDICAEKVLEKLRAKERTKAAPRASHRVFDGKVTRTLCYAHAEQERQRLGLGKIR
jgi:hypothetical protein